MSGIETPESPLDRALEAMNGPWTHCHLNITFGGMNSSDVVSMLSLRLGLNIHDSGRSVTLVRVSDTDAFNVEGLEEMLRHYFGQFPNLEVTFS